MHHRDRSEGICLESGNELIAWSVALTNGVPEAIVGGIITLAVGLAVRGAGRMRRSTV